MKKEMMLVMLLSFMVFGIALNSFMVLADDVSNSDSSTDSAGTTSSSSGSGDDSKSTDSVSETKETADSLSASNSGSRERERIREKIEKETRLEDGSRVKIKREIRIENGITKIRIEKIVRDANGVERKVELRVERDESGETRKIFIKRENSTEENEVETDLEINDNVTENESDIEVKDSLGKITKIKILPDTASEVALERLQARNITKAELREIIHNNVPRVVYQIETNKNGKFLGIFKLRVKADAQIDPETGEVIDVNAPWWAFLVKGEGGEITTTNTDNETGVSSQVPAPGNETVEETVVANDTSANSA